MRMANEVLAGAGRAHEQIRWILTRLRHDARCGGEPNSPAFCDGRYAAAPGTAT